MEEIRFEDFITEEMREKSNALVLAQRNEMLARNNLLSTDYQALKFAEGELTVEEYAEVKAKRIQWRKEVNKYSAQAKALKLEYQQLYAEAKAEYEQALQDLFGGDINEENDNTNEI